MLLGGLNIFAYICAKIESAPNVYLLLMSARGYYSRRFCTAGVGGADVKRVGGLVD